VLRLSRRYRHGSFAPSLRTAPGDTPINRLKARLNRASEP